MKKHYEIDGHLGNDECPQELTEALRYMHDTIFIDHYNVTYTYQQCEMCGTYMDIEANLTDEEVEQIINHYNEL